jgi:hypothetical protein
MSNAPTNPYYQRLFDATGGQLARARQMVQEFALIQEGFDKIGLQTGALKVQLSCSDLVSELVAGPNRAYFRVTGAMRLTEVRASVLQASSRGAIRVNVIVDGAQALFRPVQIEEGQKTSVTSPNQASVAVTNLRDDAEVVIDLLTAGQGAKGLILSFLGVRTDDLGQLVAPPPAPSPP